MAHNKYSEAQAMAKAYNILNRTGVFKEYIKTWKRRPTTEHTWLNFKEHFRQGHDELHETEDLTLDRTEYNSAHMVDEIVNRVTNDIQAHLQVMAPPPPSIMPDLATSTITSASPEVSAATANHLSTDTLLTQLLKQNQEMMKLLMGQTSTQATAEPKPRRRPKPSTGPRQGQPSRPIPERIQNYCWTHGRCSHDSKDCQSKAPNHKDDATMSNKLGGSTYGCP